MTGEQWLSCGVALATVALCLLATWYGTRGDREISRLLDSEQRNTPEEDHR